MKSHYNRKFVCKPIYENVEVMVLKQEINQPVSTNVSTVSTNVSNLIKNVSTNVSTVSTNVSTNVSTVSTNVSTDYKCKFCNKIFKHRQSKYNHEIKYCKKRINAPLNEKGLLKYINIISNEKKFIENDRDQLKKERDQLKKQVEELMTQVSTYTQNINTNNINQTIVINNYGKENMNYITQEYLNKLLKIPYMGVQNLIKNIHFNPKHPENHNIKIPNRKEKFAIVYKDGEWELRNKHNVIDNIVDNSYNILDCHFDDNKMVLNDKKRKNFIEFKLDYESESKAVKKKIEEDVEIQILNNQKQVI